MSYRNSTCSIAEWPDVFAIYDTNDGNKLVALLKKLSGGKVKTFSSVKAAFDARKPKKIETSDSGNCRDCGRWVCDAPYHAAMDGLCGECAFDEFDM